MWDHLWDRVKSAAGLSTTKVEKTNNAECATKITEHHAISGGKGTQTTNMCVNTQGVATSIEVINSNDNSKTKPGPMGLVTGTIGNTDTGSQY